MASGVGLIPEQAWELADLARSPFGTDPQQASIGFENGEPAGSRLGADLVGGPGSCGCCSTLGEGAALDRPRYTRRPLRRAHAGHDPLTVTAPADTPPSASPCRSTGTAAPGNTIVGQRRQPTRPQLATTVRTTTAGADGAFSVDVPLTGGTTVLNIVATSPSGGTARAVRTVVCDFAPGTLLFEAADPDGDDNGPGNYAYPTSDDFKPGAYDLERFQVFDAGDEIIFRVRTRDLTPTFGSPLGAQLVDVYVHVPGAAQTSTAASFPQRNYAIADAGAWSRLIEVQGFGQRYVDAAGATLGDVSIRGNAISRYITFSVTKASLGTPGPGWGFTVVLTGQDGFSPDQARGFQPTPQEFQFGVCASASADPHCTVAPGTVPKAMDVLTPRRDEPGRRARLHAAQPGDDRPGRGALSAERCGRSSSRPSTALPSSARTSRSPSPRRARCLFACTPPRSTRSTRRSPGACSAGWRSTSSPSRSGATSPAR